MKRYLVSFCNTGKTQLLAIITCDGIERKVVLDVSNGGARRVIGITGLATDEHAIYLALQSFPASLAVLNYAFELQRVLTLPNLSDLHGLACHQDILYLVSTGTNQICSMKSDFSAPVDVFWQDGSALCDRGHLNDLLVHDGQVFASLFGPRVPNRMRDGKVIDCATGDVLLAGLREPHSPAAWNGALYVLESATGDLVEARRGFAPRRIRGLIGYPRGLVIEESGFVIANSGYRDISRGTLGDLRQAPLIDSAADINPLTRSGVYFLDRHAEKTAYVDTSAIGAEIYQIVPLPG